MSEIERHVKIIYNKREEEKICYEKWMDKQETQKIVIRRTMDELQK